MAEALLQSAAFFFLPADYLLVVIDTPAVPLEPVQVLSSLQELPKEILLPEFQPDLPLSFLSRSRSKLLPEPDSVRLPQILSRPDGKYAVRFR